jgi:phosphoglycolate phosphatase
MTASKQKRRAAAFIFDLDGTLIDSGRDIARSANFARGHLGLPLLPEETLIGFVGDGATVLMRRALAEATDGEPDEEVLAAGLSAFRDHYGRHCLDHTVAYPGVLDLLLRLRRLPLMVATNKPRDFTERILAGLHLAPAFRRVVTPDDVPRPKPDPACFQACLAGLEVAAPEVVVVGDHPNDVAGARGIGAVAVGVTYGLTSPGRIRAAGPDLIIDRPGDLLALFRVNG